MAPGSGVPSCWDGGEDCIDEAGGVRFVPLVSPQHRCPYRTEQQIEQEVEVGFGG